MKRLMTVSILAILFSCSSQPKTDKVQDAPQVTPDTSKAQPAAADSLNEPVQFKSDNTIESRLPDLYERNVFSTIQSKLLPKLPERLQQRIKDNADLSLLAFATGDLFQNKKNDYAFLFYSKTGKGLAISLYDDQSGTFRQLYEDVKVENELDSQECNNSIEQLDVNLAEELVDQSGYLAKNPLQYLELTQIKITDISKDIDIILKDGCLSKKASEADFKNVLCIATSSVYNNWTCLRYDKAKDVFVVFFNQVFAD